ncbi:hypothetical protein U1Q18_013414 [Sarracenia purpurea var. burkii]
MLSEAKRMPRHISIRMEVEEYREEEEEEEETEEMVLMWEYLPRSSPHRSPLLSPLPVQCGDERRRRFAEGRLRWWMRIRHDHLM